MRAGILWIVVLLMAAVAVVNNIPSVARSFGLAEPANPFEESASSGKRYTVGRGIRYVVMDKIRGTPGSVRLLSCQKDVVVFDTDPVLTQLSPGTVFFLKEGGTSEQALHITGSRITDLTCRRPLFELLHRVGRYF